MGSWDARFQARKGRSVAGAAKANEPASSNSTMRILGFICMIGDSSLCVLAGLLRVERHHAHDAFALFDVDYLIRFDVLKVCTRPLGQRISSSSTFSALPIPKCTRKSFCEK